MTKNSITIHSRLFFANVAVMFVIGISSFSCFKYTILEHGQLVENKHSFILSQGSVTPLWIEPDLIYFVSHLGIRSLDFHTGKVATLFPIDEAIVDYYISSEENQCIFSSVPVPFTTNKIKTYYLKNLFGDSTLKKINTVRISLLSSDTLIKLVGPLVRFSWSPSGNKVVYDKSGSIWIMENDITNVKRLTIGNEDNSPIFFSESDIAFIRNKNMEYDSLMYQNEIVLIDTTGREKQIILSYFGGKISNLKRYPLSEIIITFYDYGRDNIVFCNSLTKECVKLSNEEYDIGFPYTISPDGKRVAYINQSRLIIYDWSDLVDTILAKLMEN